MKNLNERRTNYITDHMFPYVKTDLIAPSGHLKNSDSTPIVVGDIAYIISTQTGRVIAYDLGNEKTLWISDSIGNVKGHASNSVVVGDRLVVPAGTKTIIINKNTGAKIKEVFTQASGRSNAFAGGPLHWRDGDVYIGSKNQKIYGFNVSDGSIFPFMSYETGGTITSSPTLLSRGSSGDRIVIGVNTTPGKIVVVNPHSRGINSVKKVTYSVPTAAVSPDGYKAYFVDVFGRVITYNGSNDSVSVVNGVHNAFGTNGIVARMPALDESNGQVVITINNRKNGYGYVYRVNPSTGAYWKIYGSSKGIASAPTVLSNGTFLFVRADGYIISRNRSGTAYGWYSGGKSSYKMPKSSNFGRITVGGGDKNVIMTNGTDGIHIFEPDYPNIRAKKIQALDASGNSKTTFKDNEKIIIRGTFKNDGPKSISNVEHTATRDGSWQGYVKESYSVNETATVDKVYGSLAPGTYTFTFKGDPNNKVKESNEGDNNTESITITVVATKPDLEGQDTKAFDSDGNEMYTFEYGEPVTVRGYVKNIGDAEVNNVTHTHSFDGILQGNVTETSYSTNQTRWISKTYKNLKPGEYKVYAIADYQNKISEKNESNNHTPTITIKVKEPPKPDFKGTATKVLDKDAVEKYEFFEGEAITVRGYIKNESDVEVDYEVEHAQYLNGVIQEDLDARTYSAGQTRWIVKTYQSLPAGTYKVYATADPYHEVDETNEGNNDTPVVTFKVKPKPLPDIAAQTTKAYDENGNERYVFEYGERIEFRSIFRNIGEAPMEDGYEHQVYVNGKATPNITTASYDLGQSRWITRYFGSYLDPTNNAYAETLLPGVYKVYAVADPNNKSTESSKQNNKGEIITITVNAPDIRGRDILTFNSSVGSPQTTFRPNQEVKVRGTFKNIGLATANDVQHAIKLDGVEVKPRIVQDYGITSTTNTKYISSNLGTLPRGTHTIEMVADPEETVSPSFDVFKNPKATVPNERYFTFDGTENTSMSFTNVDTDSGPGKKNTVEFWMYWDGNNGSMPMGFNRLNLYFINGYFGFNTGAGDVIGFPSAKLKHKWVHVSAVFVNGDPNDPAVKSQFKIYINGEEQNLSSRFFSSATDHRSSIVYSNVTLSGYTDNDLYKFSGKLAEVRVWDHERSKQQVVDNINSVVEGNEEGLVLHAVPTLEDEFPKPYKNSYEFNEDIASSFTMNTSSLSSVTGGKTTVEFWMKWDGEDRQFMPIGFDSYALYYKSGFFGFNTGKGDVIGISSEPLKNKWVHVAAVFVNGNVNNTSIKDQLKLYINGTEQELITNFTTDQSAHDDYSQVSSKMKVSGWLFDDKYKMDGELSEIRVWNHERSVEDINADMHKSLSGFEDGLVGIASPPVESQTFDRTGTFAEMEGVGVNTTNLGKNTVEFWMKWDGVGNVVPFGFSTTYHLYFSDSLSCFGFNTNGDCVGVTGSDYTALENKWVYVTAVFPNDIPTPSNSALYFNGVKQTLSAVTKDDDYTKKRYASSNFRVGGDFSSTGHIFGGELTGIRVWNHERSESQIQRYMGMDIRGHETGLVGFWNTSKSTTGKLLDQTTHSTPLNNDATLSGFSPNPIYYQTSEDGLEVMWKPESKTSYQLYRNGTLIYNGTNNSYVDIDVTKGNSYTYTLKSVSLYGESVISTKLGEYTTNSVEITVNVVGTPPAADFDATTPKYEGEVVTFTNKTTEIDDDEIQYTWYSKLSNEPDSSYSFMSNDEHPREIFEIPGNYDIKLVAVDLDGESSHVENLQILDSKIVPGFIHDSPYYKDETISLTSTAYDEDGLAISHSYNITRPDGTSFTSNTVDPQFVGDQVGEYKVIQTVTNSIGKKATYVDYIDVVERELTAGFIHESPYYRGDLVKITSTAFGETGSILTYQYDITRPDETTFSSSSKDPQFTPDQVGYYHVKQTVSDQYGNVETYEDEIEVLNRTPVADFTYSPTTVYIDTNVSFTDQSSDPDNDPLTYEWSYKSPTELDFTVFSTDKNPSRILPVRGDWEIKLMVTDPYGDTSEVIKTVKVINRAPIANFKTDKNEYLEWDTVKVTSLASDPDGDTLTHLYKVTSPTGITSQYTTKDFEFVPNEIGNYKIEQTVSDAYGGTDTISATIPVNPLTLEGFVDHTDKWNTIHSEEGNQPDEFYSGEPFVLKGVTSNSPVDKVTVTFNGTRDNGQSVTKNITLLGTSDPVVFTETYLDESFSEPNTKLKLGPVTFTFEVVYTNGQVRNDTVTISIIGNIYDRLNFHKSY
ncbi:MULTISPECIES: LamG-like jellyroll fold domain-containing protein [Metabacillus]|uniref:LamG-like jellyroll fold domain-containing protein n=1 Tax=Metabacillus TaxID=2675233 RepID=UPI0015887C1F|nr:MULTISPECIES: LamG-like jellyroll fold domain-containing protein [Metabacillus]MCM3443567.1 hypothetical protein [Metabacillus halosaccharovorans]